MFLLLLLTLTGCNLADYEQRMLDAQIATKQRDEELKMLEGPLDLPAPKDTYLDIFFRGPRGINPSPENRDKPLAGWIHRYAPNGTSSTPMTPTQPNLPAMPPLPQPGGAVLPGAQSKPDALLEMFVAYRVEQTITVPDDFIKQFPRAGVPEKKNKTISPPGFTPFEVETWECSAADLKSAYLFAFARHREQNLSFALVYRTEPGRASYFTRTLDVSLQSLVVGPEASKARAAYEKDRLLRAGR